MMANTLVATFDMEGFPNVPTDTDVFIDAAVGRIRTHVGWHIAPVVTETVYAECHDGRTLVLPTLQLLSVSAIRAGGATYVPGDFTVYRNGSVVFNRWGVRDWWLPLGMVEADITHGYTKCPPELLPVVAAMAQVSAQSRDPLVQSMAVDGVSLTYRDGLLNDAALSRYKIPAGLA